MSFATGICYLTVLMEQNSAPKDSSTSFKLRLKNTEEATQMCFDTGINFLFNFCFVPKMQHRRTAAAHLN